MLLTLFYPYSISFQNTTSKCPNNNKRLLLLHKIDMLETRKTNYLHIIVGRKTWG